MFLSSPFLFSGDLSKVRLSLSWFLPRRIYRCLGRIPVHRRFLLGSTKLFKMLYRRIWAGGGSCPRDLWRTWRTRDCRSAWCLSNWWRARAEWRGRRKSGYGVSWTTLKLSVSTPTSGQSQPRTRGNDARRRNKRRNVSWRNRSLQKKPGLDYAMQ